MTFIKSKEIEAIKKNYPKGTRIKLIKMKDPYPITEGTIGTVDFVDGAGQIHICWDNGSSLALIPDIDIFTKSHEN